MWYVIQVAGGHEEETAMLIQKQVSPKAMKESFIPRKEKIKKFRGNWRQVEEILFSGYVFTETDSPEELFLELKHITRLTKLLQDGKSFFIPLSKEEEELIRSIGDEKHVTRVSQVMLEKTDDAADRNVVVLSGPLKGHEGWVSRYNLHKREVTVRLPFMGQETEVRMGIEIVRENVER